MFNVYKNQLSRQTGSRNLTGPKTLPTIWHTYMMLVTKYYLFFQGKYDLSREAAYNLSLIYQASGSHEYAKQIIKRYLVI
jgi:hypothetical protein